MRVLITVGSAPVSKRDYTTQPSMRPVVHMPLFSNTDVTLSDVSFEEKG